MTLPSAPPPIHAPMNQFQIQGADLLIGGRTVRDLYDAMGGGPFYAYDSNLLRTHVTDLRAVLPHDLRVHYAMKANPNPDVLTLMSGLVDGIDVASEREMNAALHAGMSPGNISFAGPGKRDDELKAAVQAGAIINIESERERDVLIAAGKKIGTRPKIAVRVNPDFELKGSGMRMGGGAKPFGIDAERVPDVLKSLTPDAVDFYGLHIFSGSNSLNAAAIIDAQTKTFELALSLAPFAPTPLRTLNIGGGFGIPYFPGEQRLDIASIGTFLKTKLPDVTRALPGVQVHIELGRYLVGEAGVYICEIIDRKISRGQVFLITNGGMHHHLALSGNFGQTIRKNYPVAIGTRMDQMGTERTNTDETAPDQVETVSIVGPLCTPLDILADKMILPRAGIGDLVVIFQSGAYGLTASPRGFLSHPDAREILV